jgi:pilus assembly protein TadC
MAVLVALVLMAAVGLLLPRGTAPGPQRLAALVRSPSQPPPPPPRGREKQLRYAAAVLAGVVTAMALGGFVGAVAGVIFGVAVVRSSGRMANAEQRRRRARLIADLPIAVDLLAACLRGGTPWGESVEAVATTIGGPLGESLNAVAAQIRLGADPSTAWLALADDPSLAPLARTAVRASQSGASLAPTLSRLARDQRRTARTAAAARARAAGIRAVAPLGLCFLPAFVLLGVVPAIAGIASTILLPW